MKRKYRKIKKIKREMTKERKNENSITDERF